MMKLLFLPLILAVSGCQSIPKETHSRPDTVTDDAFFSAREVGQHIGTEVDSREVIRLLGTGNLRGITTTHSQIIEILLRDGRVYWGRHKWQESGRYAENPHLHDIYNLVRHILANRPESETKGVKIARE